MVEREAAVCADSSEQISVAAPHNQRFNALRTEWLMQHQKV
eukprot:COSAG02_NODE_26009_length_643_cov_1.042279_1_plen_41_part_10